MQIDIYITRAGGGELLSRGMSQVYIWFHEPCLEITERQSEDDPWSLDNELGDSLKGILYGDNCRYNFLYRKGNDCKSEFGDKLIRNGDGIDIPIKLIELKEARELRFSHEVFGDGRKTGYRPTSAYSLFGFDSKESAIIWDLVVEDLQQGVPLTDKEFYTWSEKEKERPWWRFCKKMTLEVGLI